MRSIARTAAATVIALSALLTSSWAQAAVGCTESVSRVILHENGEVYFMTSGTCAAYWCQVNWSTSEKKKNALALLLTAKASLRTISFWWPNISSCGQQNASFASPTSMDLL